MMLYAASLLLFVFLLRRYLTIITVYGRSLEPTLFAGDHVLRLRLWTRRLLRQGQWDILRLLWPALPCAFTACKPISIMANIQPNLSIWTNSPNFTAVARLI